MNEREIKEANRKAFPKFMSILIICCLIGFAGGFISAFLEIDNLAESLKKAGEFFACPVAPVLMIAAIVLNLILFAVFYGQARKLMASWDGEDEEVSNRIDNLLSMEIGISSLFYILALFLLAACNSGLWYRSGMQALTWISIIGFLILIIETVIMQQKCVDASKLMNPEKSGSVYDLNFHQKWMDSSDEAEKIMIGKCAYKAFRVTNNVCMALAVILACAAIFTDIGFLPSFAVCLICAVNQFVYVRESILLTRFGTRIS